MKYQYTFHAHHSIGMSSWITKSANTLEEAQEKLKELKEFNSKAKVASFNQIQINEVYTINEDDKIEIHYSLDKTNEKVTYNCSNLLEFAIQYNKHKKRKDITIDYIQIIRKVE